MNHTHARHAFGRLNDPKAYCQSCTVRLTIGEPRPSEGWPASLRLSKDQHDLLLQAAAEFRDLCIEVREPESAIDFVDWLAVDVLGLSSGRQVEHDGAQPRGEKTLGEGRWRNYHHRHPDPLPTVTLPRSIRGAA